MKSRIIQRVRAPLWTHLPAAGVLIYLVCRLVLDGPFPGNAPVHFNWGGEPDSYGSPWLGFGLTLGISLIFIVISLVLDENWARQEKEKTFNWLTLLDEITVGFLAGISVGNIEYLKSGESLFRFPWAYIGLLAGIPALLAVLLELVRPFRAFPQQFSSQDFKSLEKEFAQRLRENKNLVYWESQNPLYVTLLTLILPLVLLVGAVITWLSQPWAALVLLFVGLLLVIPNGGLRTAVTQRDISVRFGLPGFRVLKVNVSDIAAAELKEFAPLRDFGGYGIRYNGQMTAYYMNGNRGVLLTTFAGKRYLIGSDHPEQLLAVIRAVKDGAAQS